MLELEPKPTELMEVYNRLYDSYGPQFWWPAETEFEVMLGAILTQNTHWLNVEKAINNLKRAAVVSPEAISTISESSLSNHLDISI